jgi:hypothetical protein
VFLPRPELLSHVREMLARANQTGWARSSIDTFQINVLEDNVATVLVRASRFDEQDRFLTQLYGSYTLNHVGAEWKMVSIFGGFTEPD